MQKIRVQERKRQYFNFGRPSLFPAVDFDANKDAREIMDALEKKKTNIPFMSSNSNILQAVKILGRRTADQRCEIRKAFEIISSTNLEETIKKKFPKDAQKILVESIMGTSEYLAYEINDALKDDIDKPALIDIIVGLSNNEIARLKMMYEKMFQKDLAVTIEAVLTKDKFTCDFLLRMLSGKRPEPAKYLILLRDFAGMVNMSKASKDAQFLANTAIPNINENSYAIFLLCDRTKPELRACFEEMYKIDENGFEGIIDKTVKDKDTREGLKAIGFALAFPEEYYTDRLFYSMKGIGTNDRILRRICLMRSEVDMEDIKLVYRFVRNAELTKDVEGDTSGEYKSMLCSLIGV